MKGRGGESCGLGDSGWWTVCFAIGVPSGKRRRQGQGDAPHEAPSLRHGHLHDHQHHEHSHHHHHHERSVSDMTAPQKTLQEFAWATRWDDMANFLRENLSLCCCSAALFVVDAACPHLIPKPAVKTV
ncbi:hypothetical protein SAY86_026549 [Trapa natans]|uniref:Uncharacterized protein n=1 Tax=Trapa natans TaxID=22666 RepID=A0AAN7KDX4_TRANT|nr:hypothetical protein SAY86_026549 [Trapa natans]